MLMRWLSSQAIESSSFLTLEAFATRVAQVACWTQEIERVTVVAEKPCALVSAEASGVRISRARSYFY
jgi:dihydroneopterin aldolase